MATKQNTIVIGGLFGGIIGDFVSTTAAAEGVEGQYSRSNGMDLFRPGFEGHITSPASFASGSITDASSNINSLARAAAVDVTQNPPYVYFILGGLSGTAPRVVRVLNGAYDSHQVISAHAGHNFTTIPSAGTGFWGEDVVLYQIGSTNMIFYSWNDNVDGDVGRATLAGAYTDAFMSTVAAGGQALTTNVPHRLVVGPDNMLYISDGQYVHQFDGATGVNGTLNANKYNAGSGWIVTDLRVSNNFLVIVSVRTGTFNYYTFFGKSRIAYWLTTESGLGTVYDINDFFASAAYPAFGTMLSFSIGKGNTLKVTPYNTDKSQIEVPSSLYGTPPKPNSIDIYNHNLVWATGDSTGPYICAISQKSGGFHVPYVVNDGTNDASAVGLVKNIDQNRLYAGGKFGTAYKIVYYDGTSSYYGSAKDLRSRVYKLPFKGNITKLKVYFPQMASGSTAQFSLFKNYTAISVGTAGTDMLAGKATLDQATYGSLTEYEIKVNITSVSAFYMNIRLTGQVSVSRIEVEYEPSR